MNAERNWLQALATEERKGFEIDHSTHNRSGWRESGIVGLLWMRMVSRIGKDDFQSVNDDGNEKGKRLNSGGARSVGEVGKEGNGAGVVQEGLQYSPGLSGGSGGARIGPLAAMEIGPVEESEKYGHERSISCNDDESMGEDDSDENDHVWSRFKKKKKRKSWSDLSPCGLRRESVDGNPQIYIDHVGSGLNNLGNTCYMNAVLQCLAHSAPFVERVQEHVEAVKDVGCDCILCSLNRHICRSMGAQNRSYGVDSFSPREMHARLDKLAKQFVIGRQEDAHEYLRLLLDACDKSAKRSRSVKDKMLVEDVFEGNLETRVKCCVCGNQSKKSDPFQDLSLEIAPLDIASLWDAYQHFISPESLEGENAYECEKCNKKVKAVKRSVISNPPPIVVIQLKRFRLSMKLGKPVSFPEEMEMDGKLAKLYGVVVHSGFTKSSGHYYCYVKVGNLFAKGAKTKWYKMNDSSVSSSSWDVVKDVEAYLLFYQVSTQRERHKLSENNAAAEPSSLPNSDPSVFVATGRESSSANKRKEAAFSVSRALQVLKKAKQVVQNGHINQEDDHFENANAKIEPPETQPAKIASKGAFGSSLGLVLISRFYATDDENSTTEREK